MINKILNYFLLKNSLFLKIILVFTLPALGMLYFSSVLVYDKIKTLNEVKNVQKNIEYTVVTQKLIHSLQLERSVSSIYMNSKEYKEKFIKQKITTTSNYEKYLNKLLTLKLDEKLIESTNLIKLEFYKLEALREKALISNKKDIPIVFNEYTSIINSLVNSLNLIKPVESATAFNNRFSYLVNLLRLKENMSIQRGIISMSLSNNLIDQKTLNELQKNIVLEKENKKQFLSKAQTNEKEKFKEAFNNEDVRRITEISSQLVKGIIPQNISLQTWWEISNHKNEDLNKVYKYVISQTLKYSKELQKEAYLSQILSLTFLFVSFLTLISLFFVLRNIVSSEQLSFNKIKKQQEVYKLLNTTNKFLIKIDNEKELFSQICKLIYDNKNMSFAFIYKVLENDFKIISQDDELKYILNKKFRKETNKDNLVSKVLKLDTNIIIHNYEEENISLLNDVAFTYNIKSAASFPIKKFGNIDSVLVLYSNEKYFFDEDIEILFGKMINDMSHALEKIAYEKTRKLQEDELRLASYAFESNEPMIITDKDSFIINANNAFCKVMGYSKKDVIGRRPSMFKSKHQDKEFYAKLWFTLNKEGSWSGEIYNTKKDKQKIPLRSTITAIKDDNGIVTHYLGQYIDISEQIDKQKVLEYQATHDNLTGLPNRLLLLDRIEHAITKTIRHQIIGGLIFIDLDNFKQINDTLGHDIGDKLLIMVAQKLKACIRQEDTIARIGGDEFIVLVDCIGSRTQEAKENLSSLANKIKDSLNSISHIDGHKNISTPSIGITLFKDSSVNAQDIIKQADTAMYVAKKQGKNSIEFFN
ncbi:diguanylate cyclase domain-containing protein [Arcobacter sp. YIC-80]|uniref:diguanylate cyclase domain-containing protein n=1 Tax=Arcobacter sp. YIC-80 TaxID=3376683 RepID=UPI00384FA4B7